MVLVNFVAEIRGNRHSPAHLLRCGPRGFKPQCFKELFWPGASAIARKPDSLLAPREEGSAGSSQCSDSGGSLLPLAEREDYSK